MGFVFVRNRDLHESARMETSTDTGRPAVNSGEGGEGFEDVAVPAARVAVQGQESGGGSY
ncbi:hypothetical protein [Streptomyces canus]|uniref:hypothetical protein n=1 Tax=Streptomyces canus TaxID=58343 RepID=UPI002DD94FD8|nr:hypothetical protein [Streptomyces canus]WSD85299.1 hypothetical protein OG925_13795 [Streptomyces canus]